MTKKTDNGSEKFYGCRLRGDVVRASICRMTKKAGRWQCQECEHGQENAGTQTGGTK